MQVSCFECALRACGLFKPITTNELGAINEIKLHHYLLKPWDPPEQNLYPVLDDLLEDWRSAFRPRSVAGLPRMKIDQAPCGSPC